MVSSSGLQDRKLRLGLAGGEIEGSGSSLSYPYPRVADDSTDSDCGARRGSDGIGVFSAGIDSCPIGTALQRSAVVARLVGCVKALREAMLRWEGLFAKQPAEEAFSTAWERDRRQRGALMFMPVRGFPPVPVISLDLGFGAGLLR